MLTKYFRKSGTIDRIQSSWICEPITQYIQWLDERGYQAHSIRRRIPLLLRFGDFASSHGANCFADLSFHIDSFVDEQARRRNIVYEWKTPEAKNHYIIDIRHPIQQMLQVAFCESPPSDIEGFSSLEFFKKWKIHFLNYLLEERGLKDTTIKFHEGNWRRFEGHLKEKGFSDFSDLKVQVFDKFIEGLGPQLCQSSISGVCSTLRLMMRYLYREQIIARDFSRIIECPMKYRMSSIPRSISWDEVERTLGTVDRRFPIGKRDFAILLLLITYGLRAREVAALTLDDVDWRAEKLAVRTRKAGHSTVYPLATIVGKALLDYLKQSRPKTEERRLFITERAPRKPLSHGAVAMRAAYYLQKAGVEVPRPGSHTFRHSCAQRLVDSDFSLKVIGDYLGHRSISSTEIYSKISVEALREVALGYGEEIL